MQLSITLFYIFILIFIVILAYALCKNECGPSISIYQSGYGDKKENVATLLDRTEWANKYKARLNYNLRYIFLATLLMLGVTIVIDIYLSQVEFIRGVFIMFVVFYAFHNFINHHSEKFGHYAVDRNIKIIRKKLHLKKKDLKVSNIKFSNSSPCYNFTYL